MKRVFAVVALATGIALATGAQAQAFNYDEPEIWSLVAAGERSAMLTETALNVTTNNNGTDWYYGPGAGDSMGFVKEGFCIDQDTADGADEWMNCDDVIGFNQESAQTRVSWHINGGDVSDGWRAGTVVDLPNGDGLDRRAIYTSDTKPDYYPYGPMPFVSPSDLDGWTLCWIDDYGDATALTEVWAACDGDYLLYAAYTVDYQWVGDYPTGLDPNAPADSNLANTGFDVTVLVSVGLGMIVAAFAIARRRRLA